MRHLGKELNMFELRWVSAGGTSMPRDVTAEVREDEAVTIAAQSDFIAGPERGFAAVAGSAKPGRARDAG
jgi:hypothetical protein